MVISISLPSGEESILTWQNLRSRPATRASATSSLWSLTALGLQVTWAASDLPGGIPSWQAEKYLSMHRMTNLTPFWISQRMNGPEQ